MAFQWSHARVDDKHFLASESRLLQSEEALRRSRRRLESNLGHMAAMSRSLRRWNSALVEWSESADQPGFHGDSQK